MSKQLGGLGRNVVAVESLCQFRHSPETLEGHVHVARVAKVLDAHGKGELKGLTDKLLLLVYCMHILSVLDAHGKGELKGLTDKLWYP